jgi:hypothetical protein
MHKDEVSHAFTYVYSSFFKTGNSKVRSDRCTAVGLIVHYDDHSRVDYIEVTKPVHGIVTLELLGENITDISRRNLMDLLKSRSYPIEPDYNGFDCPALGLNTYNSDPSDEDARVECLGVYPGGSNFCAQVLGRMGPIILRDARSADPCAGPHQE